MRQKIPSGIFDLLARKLDLSRELLVILEQEQAALVAMDLNELTTLSRRKSDQLAMHREIDEQLRLVVAQCAGTDAAKLSENVIRLSDLIELANEEEKKTLIERRRELLELNQEIAAKSVINYNFVEDTKRYLHDAISLISSAVGAQPLGYGKAGSPTRPSASDPKLISCEV